jgi:glycosyltransferase involved in cell wall biosynthesis
VTAEVTVVIPAWNAELTIGAAVSSALAQSVEVEVVVVDDGSTDRTAAVAEAHGPRVRVVRQANAGVATARNAGIAAATTDLVAFCDADDLLFPHHVEALRNVHPGGRAITTANAYWLFDTGIDPRKTRHDGPIPPVDRQRRGILEQNFVSTMSLFPKVLVDELGPFATDLRHAEDWEFWMRAVLAGVPVRHQPRPLALYRWGTGLSADVDAMDEAVTEVLRRALARGDLRPDEEAYVRRRLASPSPRRLLHDAERALEERRWRDATAAFGEVTALVPSDRKAAWKARLLRAAPPVGGRLLRWDHSRTDARRGAGRRVR